MKAKVLVAMFGVLGFSSAFAAGTSDPQSAIEAFNADQNVKAAVGEALSKDSSCSLGEVRTLQVTKYLASGGSHYTYVVSQTLNCAPWEQQAVAAVVTLEQVTGTAHPQPMTSTVSLISAVEGS